MIERPHWSYSQLSQYLRCPLQFFFERIARLPKPFQSSNLALGGAVHEALALHHRRIQSQQDVAKDQVKDEFLNAWQGRQTSGPIRFDKEDTASEVIERGIGVLEAYLDQPPPERIMAVEQEFVVPLHNSGGDILEKPLVAVIDLLCDADDRLNVVEFKTSARRYGELEVDRSLQATAYSHAVQEKFDMPVNVRFTVLVKTKTPAVQVIDAQRTEEDYGRLGDVVQAVEQAIAAGAFYPIESPMNCSGCPFRQPCREWGGMIRPIEHELPQTTAVETPAC